MQPGLFDEIFGNHNRYNNPKNDGFSCAICKGEIPLNISRKFIRKIVLPDYFASYEEEVVEYDRSNRVDFDVIINHKNREATKTLSSHTSCWKKAVYGRF